jgi:hypothetical protein
MLAPLLLLWPMSIAITYLVAKSIANQPFDHALEDSVTVLAQQVKEVDGKVSARLPGSARDILRADDVDSVYFQISGPRGELVDGDRELPQPPPDDAERSGRVHFRNEPCTAPGARGLCLGQPGRRRRAGANRAWRWCRWPKRSINAPSSPTRSSRA